MIMLNSTIREILVRENSVVAAIILDKDGIVVAEESKTGDKKAQELAIEYATVMKQILKVTDYLNVGALEEILVYTEKSIIVIRLITREYYLILITNTDGNIGKAKYLAKLTSERLEKEFK